MGVAKIVVLYPRPKNSEAFERAYADEHVPMVPKLEGIAKFVQTKVIGTPTGEPPPFQRIAELHFPSLEVLTKAASSKAGQDAVAHAVSISTGGPPIVLICEETISSF
ncbi:MAG TPA: EthD family reductase [Thermoanaerobaculia bacterium]|nr:EthD family reductase [Thermoanaerobaculia bacterium]